MKKERSDPGSRASRGEADSGAESPHEREVSDLYRALVEDVRDYAIYALDVEGHVLSWNEGARRLNGFEAAEIIGSHFSVFYPPDAIAAGTPKRDLREAVEKGSVQEQGWRVRKDGTQFWADVVISTMHDDRGELTGFAKVTRDLTERRSAEEELRQSEQRFRLIVQSVKDYAIFMLDPEGRVATWNEGAKSIKGYTEDEIIGRHFSAFYTKEAVESRFPQYELEVAAREGRFEDEGWRVRKDGSLFWANVVITALRDRTGRLVGYAKVTRDLTERKQSEQRELADARRVSEMEASNRAKTEFLTTVSHELRTPLNAIGGYADLLAMELPGPLNETQMQYLHRIKTGQQHLLALVNDLLNYTRIEAGGLTYDIQPVKLRGLFEDLTAMIQPQAEGKGLIYEVMSCDEDLAVLADGSRAQQILLNLSTNAVKFTPRGGRITMRCKVHETSIAITIQDTGPGIPEDKQAAIFEPFVQLGRSFSSAHEGVGLGLAISRDLARAMDGDLSVSNAPGGGAAFTLTLPRATKKLAAAS